MLSLPESAARTSIRSNAGAEFIVVGRDRNPTIFLEAPHRKRRRNWIIPPRRRFYISASRSLMAMGDRRWRSNRDQKTRAFRPGKQSWRIIGRIGRGRWKSSGRGVRLAAAERAYAIERTLAKGRDDLAALREAGEISAGEAFFRLRPVNEERGIGAEPL